MIARTKVRAMEREGVKLWIDFKGRPHRTSWSIDCGYEEKRRVKGNYEAFGLSRKDKAEESLGGAGLGGRLGAQFKICAVWDIS